MSAQYTRLGREVGNSYFDWFILVIIHRSYLYLDIQLEDQEQVIQVGAGRGGSLAPDLTQDFINYIIWSNYKYT